MSKDLYTNLYLLITENLDNWKLRKNGAVKTIIDFSDTPSDIGFTNALSALIKAETKVVELEALLENFETEIEDPTK